MLSRLCLQLASCLEVRHVCEVNIDGVTSHLPAELTDSLKEWSTLNVADCTADLCYNEVILTFSAEVLNAALNLVGDVRHNLNGLAEIVASALLVDDRLIYTTRSHRVSAGSLNACESLVVTEVKVGLHTVSGHVALTVLVRVEGTGVDVYVRVELLNRNLVAASLQQLTD